MRNFVSACVFVLASASLSAQSFTPLRELKNLSPQSIQKLETLESLNALPGGDWRFHVGDIPHGESTTLDDSSWQVVAAPTGRHYVTAPTDAVWYRRWIEVPKTLNGYDITGERIWFQFRADANGPMPEIIYFNGRRVALGDDLEPIVLFDPAKPGDRVLVAVKLLHTVDKKAFTGVSLRVEPTSSARPNPDDIRIQCITAANMLPALPTPRPDLVPRVTEAIDAIDFKALSDANQKAFDASLEKAQSILDTLHSALATATIDLDGNSHIDAAWLWPRSETIDVVRRTFTTALQLMNEYPNYVFTQSAAQYSAWMADKYPDLNKQIAERVKEGRWEIVGGMWVEPDLNLPGGESLVRQILVGQRVFHDLYGVTAKIGWNPDSFGYNWQLPQIYKRSGIDYFVTQKMHWNDTNQLPFRLFWWESPDGSKVLTYFPTDYAWDNVNPARLSADFAESAARNPGTFEHMDLYGIGDHGGGPTRAILEQGQHWINAQKTTQDAVPVMRFWTAQHYFDDVQTHLNPDSPVWNYDSLAKGWKAPPRGPNDEIGIPTWDDELYLEFHRGVYTTQAKQKANLRRSEALTLDAEKLASLAWLDGASYPDAALTEDWKKITFNDFHDLAAGSGIATIYRDAQKDFTQVFNSDALISSSAVQTIATHIDTASAHPGNDASVLVMNPMAFQRDETVRLQVELPGAASGVIVTDAHHHTIPSQVLKSDPATHQFTLLARLNNVPSLGYEVVHIAGSAQTPEQGSHLALTQDANTFTLSNTHLRAVIDKSNGCLTSLTDASGRQYLAANSCGNQLQAFVDKPKMYDAWNVDYGTFDHPMPIEEVDSISVLTDGLVRKTIRIERHWQGSHFTQDISLDAGADSLVVANTIDWHEQHILLKAAFPLAATSAKATFEIPFGTIERPTTRNNSFEKAKFEVPALRWADLGNNEQGVSILNNSKYGYDALGNTLRLTLLRSPTWPDPHADQGLQRFTYAIYPHTGTWREAQTMQRGYELNQPLTATQVFAHTGELPPAHSFVSLESSNARPNVILTAVKKAEDSNALIFRMYEFDGKASTVTLHVPPGATSATETNLMETPFGSALPLRNNTVTVPIHPYEILTLAVGYPHQAESQNP